MMILIILFVAGSFALLAVSINPSLPSIHTLIFATLVAATVLWVIKVEKEHAEHEAHIKEEHGGHLPEIPRYEYLNVRSVYRFVYLQAIC